jgi:hypothetical protein
LAIDEQLLDLILVDDSPSRHSPHQPFDRFLEKIEAQTWTLWTDGLPLHKQLQVYVMQEELLFDPRA